MLPLVALGLSAAGGILNGRAQNNAEAIRAEAQTKNVADNIAFDQVQRTNEIAFNERTLGDMLALESKNLNNQIADKERMIQAQAALLAAERERQQGLARGDQAAVGASANQYAGISGQLDAMHQGLAKVFTDAIAGADPNASTSTPVAVPGAINDAVANRETAMRDARGAEVTRDANNLAGLKSFGQLFQNLATTQGRNSQISDILHNFAAGSMRANQPALAASQIPLFVKQQFTQPTSYIGQKYVNNALPPGKATSGIGDWLQLGGAALGATNASSLPFGGSGAPAQSFNLMPDTGNFSGLGLRDTYGAPSMGLNPNAVGESGFRLPKGLGIS